VIASINRFARAGRIRDIAKEFDSLGDRSWYTSYPEFYAALAKKFAGLERADALRLAALFGCPEESAGAIAAMARERGPYILNSSSALGLDAETFAKNFSNAIKQDDRLKRLCGVPY
jgi:hypothetical protein